MLVKCQTCGKEFNSFPSQKRLFCSRNCFAEKQSKQNSASQLTFDKVVDILAAYAGGDDWEEICERFRIKASTFWHIIDGSSWKTVPRPVWFNRHRENLLRLKSLPPPTKDQLDVVIGSLLGDGSISKLCGRNDTTGANCKMTKTQCRRREEYVRWHFDFMAPYSSSVGETKNGDFVVRTVHHPFFTQMRKAWYPRGTKRVPLLPAISPLALAVWFCDDGCRHKDSRTVTICTNGFPKRDVSFLCNLLEGQHGIECDPRPQRDEWVVRIGAPGYDRFMDIVSPHMQWKCMQYKVGSHG